MKMPFRLCHLALSRREEWERIKRGGFSVHHIPRHSMQPTIAKTASKAT